MGGYVHQGILYKNYNIYIVITIIHDKNKANCIRHHSFVIKQCYSSVSVGLELAADATVGLLQMSGVDVRLLVDTIQLVVLPV